MKIKIPKCLSVRLFCMLGFLIMATGLMAQVSINKKDTPVKELLKEIEKTSQFRFFYSEDLKELNEKKTIQVSNATIDAALNKLFEGTQVAFQKQSNSIILLSRKKDSFTSNQIITASGIVVGADSEPIIGASVIVENSNTGTVTNLDGEFSLEVSSGASLIISYVGYHSLRVEVKNNSPQRFVLIEDVKALDEVVVVGYGTMKKSDVNAAIVSVKADELVKSSSPDFSSMLAGRAAGLTVTEQSAQPGGGLQIQIRGQSSLALSTNPLYVVDGFPISDGGLSPGSGNQYSSGNHSPLSDINPNDIASIEILKDASATAIYGARAANGVVLITTKRGSDQTKVEYNMSTSVQSIIKKPELLTASEFMVERNRYDREDYLMKNKIYPYGNVNIDDVTPFTPKYSGDDITNAGMGTNWYDLITRTGTVNQHNLSITHGSKNVKSLVSINVFDQKGVVKTSDYTRYSLRYNLDHKVATWWDYGVSSLATLTKENNATLGGGFDSTAGIIESALTYSPLIAAERDPLTDRWVEDTNQAMLNHPLSYFDVKDKTKSKRFLTSLYSNFHIIKNELWIKLTGGVDVRDALRENYYPTTTRYGAQIGGDANINSAYKEDYMMDVVLNYQKTFNQKHKILSLFGYSYQVENTNGASARAMGFPSDALFYYNLGAGENKPQVGSYKTKHIIASYFGRVQYSFEDKYLFTFTGRVDRSDAFSANHKSGFFPSGAFAWRAIQEDFMQNINWLSDLKVRLSLGQVGNGNLSFDAASELYYVGDNNYYLGDTEKSGIRLGKYGNSDLKWETTTEFNFGLDFGFFNNRLNGSLDVYYKETKDLLAQRALPHTSVVPWVWSNVGTLSRKGVEIGINSINFEGPLRWTTGFTFTSYRDSWLKRDPQVMLRPYEKEKAPLTAVYGLIPNGIKLPGDYSPESEDLLPGQQKYKDINGDGKIDQNDVVYMGTRAPKFTLGLSNVLEYKKFDLSFSFYAAVGGYKWASTQIEHGVYGGYGTQRLKDNYNFLNDIKDRWSSENMLSTMPSGEVNSQDAYGAPHWEKSSYLRLKHLTFGYNFADVLKTNKLDLRVFFTGQNLFTLTKYGGFDPEVENDRASYPQQRTFSFGVDVKF